MPFFTGNNSIPVVNNYKLNFDKYFIFLFDYAISKYELYIRLLSVFS